LKDPPHALPWKIEFLWHPPLAPTWQKQKCQRPEKNQQFFHETGGSFRGLKNVELSGFLILFFFFQIPRTSSHWLIQAATSAIEWHL
jgi:hypothetical protein